ncbi:ATP-binding cassette domain-containing protein [Halorubrum sp. JWXQ-INN 858]|uniref:ABC transporter ATP-binding protein n=1 Tax=Halorubrum sp. JWXQ-INN 858 TaxID=2690782 RepID=UPI001359A773|nr:ABC transporter ATP-binding protein [Halorubrum sp. JWXQ-INN 858]MWV65527.1 ATP-binding cassette domain-containing protein [Halorubrum sp. JWXQ-INN 858]
MGTGGERLTDRPETSGSWSENPIWRLYTEYGTGHRYAVVGAVATIVGRGFGLIPAFVIGLAVDAIFFAERPYALPLVPEGFVPATNVGQLYFSIAILLGAAVVGAVASWVEDWGWSVFAQRVQRNLRVDAYEHLQDQELAYFTSRRTGDLMSVLNNDVNALETFLEDGLSATLWILATVAGIGLILVSLNVPLTVITLLPIPLLAAFTLLFTRLIEPRYLSIREEIGDLNSRLENNVSGIEVIKSEGAERFETERVAEASNEYLAANLSAIKVRITYFPGLSVISGVGFAITFLVGGLWVLGRPAFGLTGTLTPGAFVTFVIYAQQFLWPIIRFGDVVDDYERAKAAGSRVQDVLSRDPTVRDRPDASPLEVGEGAVTYDGVQFAYSGETVLSDVDFDVEGGTTVGVVGPTGAGKSTLLKLLPRLYDVDGGAVRIDGQDVRDVTLRSLRRSIGYVSQEPFLFFGTVRENVRYGTFDATDDDVERAARRAQAHEFIENLPNGYETLVGERGVKLSGGQRQRLALARTMLKDPAILVLDEATSAVDTETEALIQDRLTEFAADRTTFVIAHRLSTVRTADRILVLEDGEVVEDGTHEGLLETDGLYANFWRVQTGDIASLPREFLERALRRQAIVDLDDTEAEDRSD